MKPFVQIVDAGLDEVFGDLKRTLDGLDEYELHWRPTLESNSIDWIVWHMARTEDYWINTPNLPDRGCLGQSGMAGTDRRLRRGYRVRANARSDTCDAETGCSTGNGLLQSGSRTDKAVFRKWHR